MGIVPLIGMLALGLSAAMALAWWIAVRTGESGRADAAWTFATGAAGVVAALVPAAGGGLTARQWLVAALVAVWSLRLGSHIAGRAAGADDPRYAALKAEWGERENQRLFLFLQIQAVAALALAAAVLSAARNPLPLGLADLLAIVVVAVAIGGEALADRQLARFRAEAGNRGRVCTRGLWAYSRHPNYFFEWLFWLSMPLLAVDLSGGYLFGWFSFAAPVLIYWLLVHVSGIPPLEAHMLRSRGDAFRDYQEQVNAFWPWPPRKPVAVMQGRRGS